MVVDVVKLILVVPWFVYCILTVLGRRGYGTLTENDIPISLSNLFLTLLLLINPQRSQQNKQTHFESILGTIKH